MEYIVNGVTVPLRHIQRKVSACWCSNPAFLTELDSRAYGRSSLYPSSARKGELSSHGDFGSLWFTVIFPRLPLTGVDYIVQHIDSCLPGDCWFYASREDHVFEAPRRQRAVHSCVVVLLGSARLLGCGYVGRIMEDLLVRALGEGGLSEVRPVVTACPSHLSSSYDLRFQLLVNWVLARRDFIAEAGRGTAVDGLRRGVFGYSGILRVLALQFGSASETVVCELALRSEIEDQEDGVVLPGGFAPSLLGPDKSRQTIYVNTVGK